jgi:hypothetical protein
MHRTLIGSALLLAALAASPRAGAQEATLQGLGTLPGYTGSYATGITADGSTIVGVAVSASPLDAQSHLAWVWTNGQMTALPTPPGYSSYASGIAANGRYVIGRRTDPVNAGRWDMATGAFASFGVGIQELPSAISADGSVATIAYFRWTAADGLVMLPLNLTLSISADGSKIAGLWSSPLTFAASGQLAVLQADNSLVIPPGSPQSGTRGDCVMSPDGSTTFLSDYYWRSPEPVVFVYPSTFGRAMTADGSIVYGTTASDDVENYGVSAPGRAVFLRPHEGPDRIGCFLQRLGTSTTGWQFISIRGCSADGRVLAGIGVNPLGAVEAFRIVLALTPHGPDFNGVGGLTVQDVFDYLNAWFAGSPAADFNSSGTLEVQDIFDFLNAWLGGC